MIRQPPHRRSYEAPRAIDSRRNSIRFVGRKGGTAQISIAMRVLAEIIASDVSVSHLQSCEARANPKMLAQLDQPTRAKPDAGYWIVYQHHHFCTRGGHHFLKITKERPDNGEYY
jgi:hypothetical protein